MTLKELLAYDGQDFVQKSFEMILRRSPDADGLQFFVGELTQGKSKLSMLKYLREAPECCLDPIFGLELDRAIGIPINEKEYLKQSTPKEKDLYHRFKVFSYKYSGELS